MIRSRKTSPSKQPADAVCEASFIYGVTTTGIYCRPGCASRRPLPANTRFFASFAEAERSGFRACLRCRLNARPALPSVKAKSSGASVGMQR